jgi:pimeloyl-ACP methyl ester carboxylesterase
MLRFFHFMLAALLVSISAAAQNDTDTEWLNTITGNTLSVTPGKYAKPRPGLALYFSPAGNIRVPYLVDVPKQYDPSNPVAVVVFLHGAILARDSFQYKNPGIADEPIFLACNRFNVLVVFPFARADFAWGRNEAANENIMSILHQVEQLYHVDKNKVYIGGISMGGNATYWFVNNKADQFAGFYAFSSLPADASVQFTHITGHKPLYTMNAKDDQTFPAADMAALYAKYRNQVPGWHCSIVETGGHRFIYGNDGKKHIESLMSELLGIPLQRH